MKIKLLLSVVLLVCLTNGCGQQKAGIEGEIIWQDEFDGPAGQLPDPKHWVFDMGTDWGNLQLEYDTNRPQNCSLDGSGDLVITAREESYENQRYTSARIKTKGLFERTYGRFEARIKLPIGQGVWPAFWLLGGDIDQVGWPACGEIDIMEYLGHEPQKHYGSLHGPGHSGDDALTRYHLLEKGAFNDDFHTFAVDWNEDSFTWYMDDFAFHSVKKTDFTQNATWVYDHPFFIILNVAVGGRWAGSPDQDTTFPQQMLVDYVRVYGTRP